MPAKITPQPVTKRIAGATLNPAERYLSKIITHLKHYTDVYQQDLKKCIALIKEARDQEKDVLIYGSGENAELASHANVDWTKFANVKTIEAGIPTVTAYGNDYDQQTELKEFLIHRGFSKGNTLVGIHFGDTDKTLNEAFRYCSSVGGINILITNNKEQISPDANALLFIDTDDTELAADIAQTFTHYIAVSLGSHHILPSHAWNSSYKEYSYFLCKALDNEKLSEQYLQYVGDVIHGALILNKNVYSVGNGGSAAMAAYFTQSLQSIYRNLPGSLRKIVNLSFFNHVITESLKRGTYKQDIYSTIISRLGIVDGDILLGISTSGNSTNIIHPFNTFSGLQKIAILGFGDGGVLGASAEVDFSIIVPDEFNHRSYAIAEDGQRMILTSILKHLKSKIERTDAN